MKVVQSFPKLVWSIVGAAVFFVGIYFLFQDNRVFDIVFPKDELGTKAKDAVEGARDRIYNAITPTVDPLISKGEDIIVGAYEKVKEVFGGAAQKVKSGAADALDKAKTNAIESAKNAANGAINKLAEDVGLKNDSATEASGAASNAVISGQIEFPLGFSVKLGDPAIFILKNSKGGGALSYSVDWGDGKVESGELADGDSKPLYHIWNKRGEYSLKIAITVGGAKKTSGATIVVY